MKKTEVDWTMKDIYGYGVWLGLFQIVMAAILWIEGGVFTWEQWVDLGATFLTVWCIIFASALILQKWFVIPKTAI